jgi:hypothetical protein
MIINEGIISKTDYKILSSKKEKESKVFEKIQQIIQKLIKENKNEYNEKNEYLFIKEIKNDILIYVINNKNDYYESNLKIEEIENSLKKKKLGMINITDNKYLELKEVKVNAKIIDCFSKVKITQVYKNDKKEDNQITFCFPMPSTIQIYSFKLFINNETFLSKLYEKKENSDKDSNAPKIVFEEEKNKNLFFILLGKIPSSNDDITIEIKYLTELQNISGTLKFEIPEEFSCNIQQENVQKDYKFNFQSNIETSSGTKIQTIHSKGYQTDIEKQENTAIVTIIDEKIKDKKLELYIITEPRKQNIRSYMEMNEDKIKNELSKLTIATIIPHSYIQEAIENENFDEEKEVFFK